MAQLSSKPLLSETFPDSTQLKLDDGIPMESIRHKFQMVLLIYPLRN